MDRGRAVRDWMSRKPATVQADSPIGAAVALMHQARDSPPLLVMGADRLTGILSSRGSGAPRGRRVAGAPVRAGEPHHDRGSRDRRARGAGHDGGARAPRDEDRVAPGAGRLTRYVGILTLADALESLLWFARGAAGGVRLASRPPASRRDQRGRAWHRRGHPPLPRHGAGAAEVAEPSGPESLGRSGVASAPRPGQPCPTPGLNPVICRADPADPAPRGVLFARIHLVSGLLRLVGWQGSRPRGECLDD